MLTEVKYFPAAVCDTLDPFPSPSYWLSPFFFISWMLSIN